MGSWENVVRTRKAVFCVMRTQYLVLREPAAESEIGAQVPGKALGYLWYQTSPPQPPGPHRVI